MRSPTRLLLAGLAFLTSLLAASALAAKLPQRVLYVGERAAEFAPLLEEHFAQVECLPLTDRAPAATQPFDVVLLDWPQSQEMRALRLRGSPLGRREDWHHPTVLAGSSGLNLAVAWHLKGGAGCTCLAPVAYDLRPHEIFAGPIPIDRSATVEIPTPHTFTREIEAATIQVIPLVDGITHYASVIDDHDRGWCSYYYEFADVPEVEFFCGGINEKTPRASAVWRQGHLLHFGFQQSPAELNATGRALLVNALAYISRFTEDRPIDQTLSVFGDQHAGLSRRRARNLLTSPHYRPEWVTTEFSPRALAGFDAQDADAARRWADAHGDWLHPVAGNLLEPDEEARELGTPFDAPEFIPRTIAALRDPARAAAAAKLLARYVPEGPVGETTPAAWETWWQAHAPYVFYTELGGYRWHVDPLAKSRALPTAALRGPERADHPR